VKFKEIGWNGFLMKVPEEMHITRQGGNAQRGTFIIESEGHLIEFSWQPVPNKPKPLLSIVETIIDQAKKDAEKKKQKFSIEERRDTTVKNHDAIYLRLKAPVEERYYIWNCQESGRLIASRFVFETFDEKTRKFVKQFLSTLQCHMKEKNIWALMKIRFETPQSFLLEDAKIEISKAHIVLTENKFSAFEESKRTICVAYFPMANLRFKDTYEDPEKWFEKNYMKDLKKTLRKRRFNFKTIEKKELKGHVAIIKQAKATTGIYVRSTDLCSNASWYCPEMNRMYSLSLNSKVTRPLFFRRQLKKEEHDNLFNEIFESFHCH